VTAIVSYVRVRTSGQRLGIEAQRQAIARFAEAEQFDIINEFVEVNRQGRRIS
jgi:DNA invertase Pin-like site-specific DNA recombinase